MKSFVEVQINKPKAEVEWLFTDPANNPKWMHDLKKYEPVSGVQGMPGSTYRLIPEKGNRIFHASVITRNSQELKLKLDARDVKVLITAQLVELTPLTTMLVSEEEFIFKGIFSLIAWVAKPFIRKAHRNHINSFKDFAETYGKTH